MFRFKKVAQKIETAIKEVLDFEHNDTHEVIKTIHNEFDTSADKALLEAREILAKSSEFNQEKIELLRKAGFTANKNLERAESEQREKKSAQRKADIVIKWSQKYPNNKFIFVDDVNEICSKYGLVCGSVDRYIGEIPYKNLLEINNFKPNEEDIFFLQNISSSSSWRNVSLDPFSRYNVVVSSIDRKSNNNNNIFIYKEYSPELYYQYFQVPLYICAPIRDMKFDEQEKKGNFLVKEYPDPIVLHFVKDGFLIVSKWGLEAGDDMLK